MGDGLQDPADADRPRSTIDPGLTWLIAAVLVAALPAGLPAGLTAMLN